jgi:hypothetical protein
MPSSTTNTEDHAAASQAQTESTATPETFSWISEEEIEAAAADAVVRITAEQDRNGGVFRPVLRRKQAADVEVAISGSVPACATQFDRSGLLVERPEWDMQKCVRPERLSIETDQTIEERKNEIDQA